MRTPYTYLIGWPEHDRWYYGVRYARDCHPDELWVTYFTSSRHVSKFAEEHGDPSVIAVRKIFEESEIHKARLYEHRVLRRMRVIGDKRWLNRTNNKSIEPKYGDDNSSKRPEVKKKISESVTKTAKRGVDHPLKNPDTRLKVSKKLKGRKRPWAVGDLNVAKRPEVRKKLSRPGELNPFFGKNHTDELKEETSKRFKGVPKEKVTCPHCGKTGGKNVMVRWHFDNCKHK